MRALAILPLLLTLALSACAGDGANTAAAPTPSFDCTKTTDPVQPLICEDPQLSRLDSELAATVERAASDANSVPSGEDLRSAQRRWIVSRNQCGANADPRACLVHSYAARIQQLRMGSPVARSPQDGDITFGPFAVACDTMSDPLVATFINAEPNLVYISGSLGSLVLTQGMSASGARYVDATETTVFWNKGNTALFQRPGEPDTNCTLTAI